MNVFERTAMKTITLLMLSGLLFGCGVETLGVAATTAKLQAEQVKQGKETLKTVKENIDIVSKATEQSAKQAELVEQTEQATKN